jgi:flavin reductase (DIM6/NTAB) family NADH-FMN oxidoreductase RutF
MFFDLAQLGVRDSYKLLTSVVVPRPIALVTSVSPSGLINAAPYSFFNLLGSDPPIIALGVGDRSPGEGKDTAHNIETSREFVVNIVDEALAPAMNDCAVDFPANWSEVETLGLATSQGQIVSVPHLSEAPASLECRFHSTVHIGRNRIILGEVVGLRVRDEFVDAQKFHVQTGEMNIVGRGGGGNEGGYFRTSDTFGLKRQSFDEWQRQNEGN